MVHILLFWFDCFVPHIHTEPSNVEGTYIGCTYVCMYNIILSIDCLLSVFCASETLRQMTEGGTHWDLPTTTYYYLLLPTTTYYYLPTTTYLPTYLLLTYSYHYPLLHLYERRKKERERDRLLLQKELNLP